MRPDARNATMKEAEVIRFGVIHLMSTMTQLHRMASGEVTNDDHHSSSLFFVSHSLLSFSPMIVSQLAVNWQDGDDA
jgi:hypothetical protein